MAYLVVLYAGFFHISEHILEYTSKLIIIIMQDFILTVHVLLTVQYDSWSALFNKYSLLLNARSSAQAFQLATHGQTVNITLSAGSSPFLSALAHT